MYYTLAPHVTLLFLDCQSIVNYYLYRVHIMFIQSFCILYASTQVEGICMYQLHGVARRYVFNKQKYDKIHVMIESSIKYHVDIEHRQIFIN
jgi:hypothetical protein